GRMNGVTHRYLSPNELMFVTINFPSFSGREASSTAAQTLAPDVIPPRIDSSVASLFAITRASSETDLRMSVSCFLSRISGTKPAPIPSI
ncbi:hypothetical protein PFISCL1PPCAC_5859, partial [Pristionchus fissidentatus]